MIDRMMSDNKYLLQVVIIATLALAALWGCYRVATYRVDVNARVVSIGWDTKIDVLRWQTNNRGGWYVPDGGRETNSYIKQSGTRRVKTGTNRECSGSGEHRTCRNVDTYRYDPVYDRWYEFDIDEWTHIEPLIASGTTHNWYMPDTTDGVWYDTNRAPIIGDKRLSTLYTHFYVVFITKNATYTVDMIESMWKEYDIETSAIVTLDFFNNVKAVKKAGW